MKDAPDNIGSRTVSFEPAYPLRPFEPMDDSLLRKALEHCAQEPIHIPGSIQPDGVLFALDGARIIRQVSANSAQFLGRAPEELLNLDIAELLGGEQTVKLFGGDHYAALQHIRSFAVTIDRAGTRQTFDAVTHRSGERIILELERRDGDDTPQAELFYDELRDFSIAMRQAPDLDQLHHLVVESVRKLTGFDRVKLYQFDHEWNGEVIAESKADHMPSFLGQHFPHSDIPPQARLLYAKNYLRLISDIRYLPIPILTAAKGAEAPLDLSLSVLRSVSPVHVQYLTNMGVSASMSISIIQNDKLWGLIACHHASPKHIPYRTRMVAELMGHIFSAQLSSLEEMQRKDHQQKRSHLLDSFSSALESSPTLERILAERYESAFEALDACGAAFIRDGAITLHGQTPETKDIAALAAWLHRTHSGAVFHTHDLVTHFGDVPELAHLSGGLLATPLGHRGRNYLLWFRARIDRTVAWAGKPEKEYETSELGLRLTPRGSFALWQETVKGRAVPWQPQDIALAQSLVGILLESERIRALEASSAKSEFLANMSHELRTPMNAVIGLTTILGRSEPLTKEQRGYVSTLNLCSHSLLSLINDLLDVAKIESQEMQLDHQPMNLCEILEEVRSMMAVKATEKKLHLNVTFPPKQDCHFLGDALRVRQVTLNLVSNAVKFTDHGFINVSLRINPPESEEARPMVQIEVSDTGIGMTDTQVEKVFDKFVQADPSISRRFGGSGLGLSITKHLIELMGGKVSVVSRPGMGTKFTVLLPLEPHAPAVRPALPSAITEREGAPFYKARGKILLTEDYEGNIMVALTYLQDLGYDVTVARNGREACDKFSRDHFDAVLMDVQMPVMDGYSATIELRRTTEVPIIGMTAHALAGDRQKCLDAGMNDYISKPFSFDELKEKLEHYVGKEPEAPATETSLTGNPAPSE